MMYLLTLLTATMSMSSKETTLLIYDAMVDTCSNVLFSAGLPLLPAKLVSNTSSVKPVFGVLSRRISDIGNPIHTIGTKHVSFKLGEKKYSVCHNIVPRASPLIVSHRDLDDMGINYQTFHKSSYTPEDKYKEKLVFRNYLLYLTFPKYGYPLKK